MFYCSACGVPLRPGQTKCTNCFQAFPHSVPDAVPDTEYRAHYWPPHQSSTAEDAVRRARTWWEGINNGKKAAVFGGLALVLMILMFRPHQDAQFNEAVAAGQPYRSHMQKPQFNPDPQPASPTSSPPPENSTRMPRAASAPADPPQAYIPPASYTPAPPATQTMDETNAQYQKEQQDAQDEKQRAANAQQRAADAQQQQAELNAHKVSLDKQINELKSEEAQDQFDSMGSHHGDDQADLHAFEAENERHDAYERRIAALEEERNSLPGY